MAKIVDFFLPSNCRVRLYRAADENRSACLDTLCLLKENRTKLIDELTHTKAA